MKKYYVEKTWCANFSTTRRGGSAKVVPRGERGREVQSDSKGGRGKVQSGSKGGEQCMVCA